MYGCALCCTAATALMFAAADYFYKGFSLHYHMQFSLYREVITFVDWFMAIGATPAVKHT
jgi:hypothetical protein